MGLDELLNHKCDIYHIVKEEASPGFSLPASPKFTYPETPDEVDVPCHFGVKSGNRLIIQTEPQADYQAKIKLTVPLGTDIRLNDKIIDTVNGYEYTADIPVRIRNHHLFAMISRKTAQEAL